MRNAVVKEWYGGSCEAVESYISRFNRIIDENVDKQKAAEIFSIKPKAVIVPHAGWMYSGFTANFAYRIAQNANPVKVAVIGPSHKFAFEGVSVTLEDEYETPCGNLKIDRETSKELIKIFGVQNLEHVHVEHSTEVQMPFIKHYLNLPVVELIYSHTTGEEVGEIIDFALARDSLVVISTDLSHYHRLEEANRIDRNCLEAVLALDLNRLQFCEACGKVGLEGIIRSARRRNLVPILLDYRTSADVSGDNSNVVGYMSGIFV